MQQRKVLFEPEDFPPFSYYNQEENNDKKVVEITQKDRSAEWRERLLSKDLDSIPEFVPRSQRSQTNCVPAVSPNTKDFLTSPNVLPHRAAVPLPYDEPALPMSGFLPINPGLMPASLPLGLHAYSVLPPVVAPPLPPPMVHRRCGEALFSVPALPHGYSANVTHINTGLGPPMPAILLKKKRKKKNRVKLSIEEDGKFSFVNEASERDRNNIHDATGILPSSENARKSEPDLTLNDFCEELPENDLMVSTASVKPAISCPELSAEELHGGIIQDDGTLSEKDIEIDNPALFGVLQSILCDGTIQSPAVKALDAEVMREMNLEGRFDRLSNRSLTPDTEDALFDRLLQECTQTSRVKQTQPCRPMSLQEELDENIQWRKRDGDLIPTVHRTGCQSAVLQRDSTGRHKTVLLTDSSERKGARSERTLKDSSNFFNITVNELSGQLNQDGDQLPPEEPFPDPGVETVQDAGDGFLGSMRKPYQRLSQSDPAIFVANKTRACCAVM